MVPGAPEGSTGSDSGFKASQKTGPWLKASSDRLGEARKSSLRPLVYKVYAYPLHYEDKGKSLHRIYAV